MPSHRCSITFTPFYLDIALCFYFHLMRMLFSLTLTKYVSNISVKIIFLLCETQAPNTHIILQSSPAFIYYSNSWLKSICHPSIGSFVAAYIFHHRLTNPRNAWAHRISSSISNKSHILRGNSFGVNLRNSYFF